MVVLNINSIVEDTNDVSTFKDLETIIDKVCKQHTDMTLGTDEYEQYECPFIYVQPEYTMNWPTLGELVNYDPEAAMWEGDGDHVGVQSRLILTHGESIRRTGGDMSHYFSKVRERESEENIEGVFLCTNLACLVGRCSVAIVTKTGKDCILWYQNSTRCVRAMAL